jgi:DNA-binding transcriptional regulator YbjK
VPELEAKKAECCETGSLLVKRGKALVAEVNELIPDLARMRYSDADIDAFFSQMAAQKKELSYFLEELRGNGQISAEQYEKMASKYHLEKKAVKATKKMKKRSDCAFQLLLGCLERHMKKGSRFSCFSSCAVSRFEIPEFFEAIVTNANVDYQERVLEVEGVKVLVSTVEKLDG